MILRLVFGLPNTKATMPLRNVWATPAALEATKQERTEHARSTTKDEAVRLLDVMARAWSFEPEAAEEEGLCAALCVVLKRLGRDMRTAYLLEANLDAWIVENGATQIRQGKNGALHDRRLLAASALYDVRVVVLSTASPEALAYDASPDQPGDEITLGHCHADLYVPLADARPGGDDAAPERRDVYAHMANVRTRRRPAKEPRVDKVLLAPEDVRACASSTQPDFYVSEAGAAELSGAHAADLGVNVGRVEDRVPPVQYLSTPAACYRYGCYVLPTGAE